MRLLSYFGPKAPYTAVYMLQLVEYDSVRLASWLAEMPNLTAVRKRQSLDLTARAKLTLLIAYLGWAVPMIGGLLTLYLSGSLIPLFLVLVSPLIGLASLMAFNSFFDAAVVRPSHNREIEHAKSKLSSMQAERIAVIGSYGKTSMKEILTTVLSEGKKTAATPGNKNVLISHARWVNNDLDGDEDIVVFEYGEFMPGDIEYLADFSRPGWAFITGLAPAHMDNYQTLGNIAADFKDIFNFAEPGNVFTNAESKELVSRIKQGIGYTAAGCDGWKAQDVKAKLTGLEFTAVKASQQLKLKSGLIGEHNLGPLLAAVALASKLGLSGEQIIDGVAKTKPFEHRMQPYEMGGALIIDDTYNGNIDGMKAGLKLLAGQKAKRKIYVTPGLVEQGAKSHDVHFELGKSIAESKPDITVLMQNSAASSIKQGLESAGYKGDLMVEENPLEFYQNLDQFVAAGDIVLLQNDWPDSYR